MSWHYPDTKSSVTKVLIIFFWVSKKKVFFRDFTELSCCSLTRPIFCCCEIYNFIIFDIFLSSLSLVSFFCKCWFQVRGEVAFKKNKDTQWYRFSVFFFLGMIFEIEWQWIMIAIFLLTFFSYIVLRENCDRD